VLPEQLPSIWVPLVIAAPAVLVFIAGWANWWKRRKGDRAWLSGEDGKQRGD
jgi:hypothetical protein